MIIRPELWQIPRPTEKDFADLLEKETALFERIHEIAEHHQHARFASSLAAEDMVITDVIAKSNAKISVFTLETGRLNPETLALVEAVKNVYPDLDFQLFHPVSAVAEKYDREKGRFAFYESVELRRECCYIRKIEPLNRALKNADCWLTGQRREQSVTRTELAFREQDRVRGIDKYNPIFDWHEIDVWAYILKHNIPYNELYKQGCPSIGCEPCTKPVKQGEDIRAGRWWWENKDSKECGLHK
ncbi:phosphoadenosine phosphosulfate reductase [Actinobacillus succinogenes]|uniref:Adenosine 5'-phosphosulfate reductase n=1 Tax=Actinobacillus succinogenes (strain ATCC 55618 / DSM 22257 / CCUG 43843 / 130Z) TaxID=339671 RepID=A6VPZ5_ACTSZ|nr:phosphoadenylyl-sulfate reductase [Actinobacillus succinogenes]ABR75042.1 adenylylsulfate reductase, thioredoxin dependent [Actinobacillus succinogenes 130Z]PHI40552.1 phosphoadenosine phosphosulfate reductase [Actinobacillus succinogenes]